MRSGVSDVSLSSSHEKFGNQNPPPEILYALSGRSVGSRGGGGSGGNGESGSGVENLNLVSSCRAVGGGRGVSNVGSGGLGKGKSSSSQNSTSSSSRSTNENDGIGIFGPGEWNDGYI